MSSARSAAVIDRRYNGREAGQSSAVCVKLLFVATVHVTPNLQRHVATESASARGETVAEVLSDYFRQWPALRGYVLQDAGVLRTHMTIFVNGLAIQDRKKLSDPVPADGEVYIMQALSGG
jgi:sulfur-carrier protein